VWGGPLIVLAIRILTIFLDGFSDFCAVVSILISGFLFHGFVLRLVSLISLLQSAFRKVLTKWRFMI